MVASTFTHDRGAAGRRQVLLHVLPVAGSDKVWYLNAARAGLLHGVWEPPQRVQPRHDRTARLARTGPQRHHFHPSWWPRVAWGTASKIALAAADAASDAFSSIVVPARGAGRLLQNGAPRQWVAASPMVTKR